MPHLLFRVVQDPRLRLTGGHRRDALELLPLYLLERLQLVLQLLQVLLAVGDPLVTARQLGQLARDVVLLGEHALLDLDDGVAPLPQLRLELRTQLDRLLPRLDVGLAAGRLGVTAGFVEQEAPLAPGRGEARAGLPPQHEQGQAGAGG